MPVSNVSCSCLTRTGAASLSEIDAGRPREIQRFVPSTLVPRRCRFLLTSRPEGVDLEDYKHRFVVMNLLELSQEQQRNVIQMQLQGNAFFEHLVNIAECRKDLDAKYKEAFRSEGLRAEIESSSRSTGSGGRGGGWTARPASATTRTAHSGCPRRQREERDTPRAGGG